MQSDKKNSPNIVTAYRRYLKLQRNFSPNTVDAYLRDLQKLLTYLEGAGIQPS